ncbi:MAG: nucleoside-diphosphate kinase [Fidelibacterota bacterium]
MKNRTLAIIKPDAVRKRLTGKIIDRILDQGFDIVALRQEHLTRDQAEEFYAVHRDRGFFHDLVEFMITGPCVVMVLEKERAVDDFRTLMGTTDPSRASEGTIRREFAEDIQRNAVHGSDSDENASKEIAFFFPSIEIPTR